MPITYQNTWDEIQRALISGGANNVIRRHATDALEIKTAVESIEQQKKLAEFQTHLLDQQKEITKLQESILEKQKEGTVYQEKLASATKRLSCFTAALVAATVMYVIVSIFSLRASKDQAASINDLQKSIQNVVKTLSAIPGSIEKLPLLDKKLKRIHPHSALKENELQQRIGGYGTSGRR